MNNNMDQSYYFKLCALYYRDINRDKIRWYTMQLKRSIGYWN